MTNIKTSILYENDITDLSNKFHSLRNIDISHLMFKDWIYTKPHKLGYEKVKKANVIFLGQTGYGKSSLINSILNRDVFKTSDYQSCTKVLQAADFHLNHNHKNEKLACVLSFVDLPGIGESDKADEKYLNWYREYVQEAAVIVYLFRADKRDHTQDEFFFNHVFDKSLGERLICVVSQADKIEPLSRGDSLSEAQKQSLKLKKTELKRKSFLNIKNITMIPVSTLLNYNIYSLEDHILDKLRSIS